MRPLHELRHRGQIGRLRRLGAQALHRFGIWGELVLLGCRDNCVFRVGDHVLRIHRPGIQTEATIRSELAWLEALADHPELGVPRFIRGLDGDPLQRIAVEGVPEPRYCVVFRWLNGHFRRGSAGPGYFRRLGRVTALLHEHAKSWPAAIARIRWDAESIIGAVPSWGSPFRIDSLRRDQARLLESLRARLQPVLEEIPGPVHLIHADLHPGNVLFEGKRTIIIDFDDCGFGWPVWDLTVSMGEVRDRADRARLLGAWLDGYRSAGNPPSEQLPYLDALMIARQLQALGWLYSRRVNPALGKQLSNALAWTLRTAEHVRQTGRLEPAPPTT